MVTAVIKSSPVEQTWNFGTVSLHKTLKSFIDEKGRTFAFFEGKEPWAKATKVTWDTFFRFCTEEMDDLSKRTCTMVIEYCLSIVEEIAQTIKEPVTLAKVHHALASRYEETYENPVFQYRWAISHPIIEEAVNTALKNRYKH
jgi:hypothetical protein